MASPRPEQDILIPHIAFAVADAGGMIRIEDLDSQEFDPKKQLSMSQYIGEIGLRLSDEPRETSSTDTLFGLYGRDFDRAEPSNLKRGLYHPANQLERTLPKKAVIKVTSEWYSVLNRKAFPGQVPFSTGVAANEDLYEDIVVNAPYMSNRIFNRTQRKNQDNPNKEEVEDLAGESVFYAMSEKNQVLEDWDQALLSARSNLTAVRKNILETNAPRPVKKLEPFRISVEESIHDMVHAACRGLGYGTNETRTTHLAVASNIYRYSAVGWLKPYVQMAIDYNDALRGKIDQSQQAVFKELRKHSGYVIRNLDREYES
jgi:hypothetical protein